jgi:meiotically up-regulated gene 157 (Mug157) protein
MRFTEHTLVPPLDSLPYLGFVKADDPVYLRTRKMVLSKDTNKYVFNGSAGWGIGGPHIGYGFGWPMSRSMQVSKGKMSAWYCSTDN